MAMTRLCETRSLKDWFTVGLRNLATSCNLVPWGVQMSSCFYPVTFGTGVKFLYLCYLLRRRFAAVDFHVIKMNFLSILMHALLMSGSTDCFCFPFLYKVSKLQVV